jgi:alkylation response protein AidB-like acyl-CoA dehydrogenase
MPLDLRKIKKMGGRAVDANEVFFDHYKIPANTLIGEETLAGLFDFFKRRGSGKEDHFRCHLRACDPDLLTSDIDRENPGLDLRKIKKMGGRAVDANEVFFDHYKIHFLTSSRGVVRARRIIFDATCAHVIQIF